MPQSASIHVSSDPPHKGSRGDRIRTVNLLPRTPLCNSALRQRRIPGIAGAKFALNEQDLDACGTQHDLRRTSPEQLRRTERTTGFGIA